MSTTLAKDFWVNLKYWVRKHRRAVALSVAAGVGGYFAYRYYRSLLKVQLEQEAKRKDAEEHAEVQLQHHFESIQRIADATTLPSVLPHLKDQLFSLVDLSVLTEKLMAGKGQAAVLGHKEKVEIWEKLKVLSFTRTVSAVFSVALLDVFLRTQLNILGRHVYLETARDSSGEILPELQSRLTKACQHRFVGLVDYLPYTGLRELVADVQRATEQVVGRRELRDKVQLAELGDIFQDTRRQLESQNVQWGKYVLPVDTSIPLPAASGEAEEQWEAEDERNLIVLMEETQAVLSRPDFANVLSAALDCLLGDMQTELQLAFQDSPDDGIPLAKLLPHVAGVGNALLEFADDNKFVKSIAGLPTVQTFCAAVYSGEVTS